MDSKILGGILLIIGTSIGGGILALPIVSASSGFIPSVLMLIACWAIMTFSAFLILEVNLWLPPRNNLITMAHTTLGKLGAAVTWLSYILLLYSLLAAYISGGASLLNAFTRYIHADMPAWIDSILFVIILGYVVFRGIKFVDYANRFLMVAKLGSLFALIFWTVPYMETSEVITGNPSLILGTVTVMLTSFGFANMIPSLRSYFNGDVKKLRLTVLIGSLIPLGCYILWNLAILATIPRQELMQIMAEGGSVAALTSALSVHLHSHSISMIASFFTTICVLTAFLCVSLALSDFLADGLKVEKKGKGNWLIFSLTFLPSLILVLYYPSIFVKALNYAGIFCVILIVLLPAMMALSGRYHKKIASGYQVMGGPKALYFIIFLSICIIALGIKEAVF